MSIEMLQTCVIGTPLSTATLVTNEVPTPAGNGVLKIFDIAYTPTAGSIQVYLRGQRLAEANATDGYTRSGTTITLGSAVTAPASNDTFLVDYRKA
jgi:hypothetical protein